MRSLLIYSFLLSSVLISCYKGESVDLVVHNAKIHTLNDKNKVAEAMAIRAGKIVEVGPERQILNKYAAAESIDAGGKDVYPGFTDAHGHLLSLARQRLSADLTGTKSFDELLRRIEKYAARNPSPFILGTGWDQSLWADQTFPTNEQLNVLFPDVPVLLIRVDGHAALANAHLLQKAHISPATHIEGGMVTVADGKCTGLLLDHAIDAASALIPPFSDEEMATALEEIQEELFQFGITGVHEAGIHFRDIAFFKKLVASGKLKLNLYAMLFPSVENQDFVRKNGIYSYQNLSIRSFKVIGDGALGSHGACLKSPYSDQPGNHGILTTSAAALAEIADFCRQYHYQLNTHAIGDSTNQLVIDMLTETYAQDKDHRWRIEHAQVLSPRDILRLGACGAFPSVQPTHAVSDQRWAAKRLGPERLKGAYAYKSILDQTGIFAIGTDFPVESFNPFLTIHAAVQRKDKADFPQNGFQVQEAISFEDCIRGMTIWAAFAAFQEQSLGSLETNKDATFAIFEFPVGSSAAYRDNYAYMTFIQGKKVYSAE